MNGLTIHGVRGTQPGTGPDTLRYGGHTTCFSIETADRWIVIDAGTGLFHLNKRIGRARNPRPFLMLFTHLHLDHVCAVSSFGALWRKGASVTFMADGARDEDWRKALRLLAGPPFWPVGLDRVPASVRFANWPGRLGPIRLKGLTLRAFPLRHPQQCIAIRADWPNRSVVVATDLEVEADAPDPAFIRFCAGADALVFDAHFTPEEFPAHRGWGHSTWEAGVRIAEQAGVRQLILTHHAPGRTDAAVDAILEKARRRFPATWAAHEGMVVPIRTSRCAPPCTAGGRGMAGSPARARCWASKKGVIRPHLAQQGVMYFLGDEGAV